jgi:putative hemolysin
MYSNPWYRAITELLVVDLTIPANHNAKPDRAENLTVCNHIGLRESASHAVI